MARKTSHRTVKRMVKIKSKSGTRLNGVLEKSGRRRRKKS